jgi:hypothetical protein
MKKIIRLTESDLARIVRRVINEEKSSDIYTRFKNNTMLNLSKMGNIVSANTDDGTLMIQYDCVAKKPIVWKMQTATQQDKNDIVAYCNVV